MDGKQLRQAVKLMAAREILMQRIEAVRTKPIEVSIQLSVDQRMDIKINAPFMADLQLRILRELEGQDADLLDELRTLGVEL